MGVERKTDQSPQQAARSRRRVQEWWKRHNAVCRDDQRFVHEPFLLNKKRMILLKGSGGRRSGSVLSATWLMEIREPEIPHPPDYAEQVLHSLESLAHSVGAVGVELDLKECDEDAVGPFVDANSCVTQLHAAEYLSRPERLSRRRGSSYGGPLKPRVSWVKTL